MRASDECEQCRPQKPTDLRFTRQKEDPIHDLRLSNGLRMIYVQRPESLDEPHLGVFIKLEDTVEEKTMGLAHFVEHLLVRFARQCHDTQELKWSGETSLDTLIVKCGTPRELGAEVFATLYKLFASGMDGFTEGAFIQEKAAIIHELNLIEKDIPSVVHRLLLRTVYPGHAIGVGDAAGVLSDVSRTTLTDVFNYGLRVLSPRRAVLSIAGNLGPLPELIRAVEAICETKVGPACSETK